MRNFCLHIVEATQDYAAALKINTAFFEVFGSAGWVALESLRDAIPHDLPLIIDAKRGDIGNTSEAYARALFEELRADAVTVNPYLGWDSLQPFLAWPQKGVFVLCRTSNPGSRDVQQLEVAGDPLYMHIARGTLAQRSVADLGLVIGATQPEALRAVRAVDADLLFLAPGVGAQGARAEETVLTGANSAGDNVLVAASRDILYASAGDDYAQQSRKVAESLARATWDAREVIGART